MSRHSHHPCPAPLEIQGVSRFLRQAWGRAFTLVEMLVVVAILGLLAALAVPVFNRVSDARNKAASISNLRQIGVLLNTFAGENNNNLPGFVPSAASPYGRTSFGFTHDVAKQLVDGGYVSDTRIFFPPGDKFRRRTLAQSTNGWAQNPEVGDTRWIWSGYWHLYIRPGSTWPASSIEASMKPRARLSDDKDCIVALDQYQVGSYAAWNRDGGVNALRLGGHVTYLPKAELNPSLGAAQFSKFETPR